MSRAIYHVNILKKQEVIAISNSFISKESSQFLMNNNIYCHEACHSPLGLCLIMMAKATALNIVNVMPQNIATLTQ